MKKVNIPEIMKILKKEFEKNNMPIVDLIKAQTKDPFKILVATILSARTKDQTTSAACLRLFKKVDNIEDLEKLNVRQIEKLIYPVGFYKNKAKYLKKLPKVLCEKFNCLCPCKIS